MEDGADFVQVVGLDCLDEVVCEGVELLFQGGGADDVVGEPDGVIERGHDAGAGVGVDRDGSATFVKGVDGTRAAEAAIDVPLYSIAGPDGTGIGVRNWL